MIPMYIEVELSTAYSLSTINSYPQMWITVDNYQ